MRVLSIGEVLWDHCGAVKTIGGAPLNFSAHLSRLGNTVAILSAVGQDEFGQKALEEIGKLGVDRRFLQSTRSAPTGGTRVTTGQAGEPSSMIIHPAAYEYAKFDPATVQEVCRFAPDWLYIGTLFHSSPHLLEQTLALRQSMNRLRVLYDVNLRRDNWNLQLVERLSHYADIVKMNESEARTLADTINIGGHQSWLNEFCCAWLSRFNLECICISLGSAGCAIAAGNTACVIPCIPISPVDALGAGDAFCAGFLHAWHHGWNVYETGELANFLGRVVATKSGAIPEWSVEECRLLQEQFGIPPLICVPSS
jgi:fructokinase